MVEVIAPGNFEGVAVTWLTGKLGSGIGIHSRVPDPRPASFVKVIRTGGHKVDLAYYEAQLTFECWGPDEDTAGNLAALTYGQFFAVAGEIVNGIFIRKIVEVGGIVNDQDQASTTPRYVFTVGAQGRMTVLTP
jgi:hypothetical protein